MGLFDYLFETDKKTDDNDVLDFLSLEDCLSEDEEEEDFDIF